MANSDRSEALNLRHTMNYDIYEKAIEDILAKWNFKPQILIMTRPLRRKYWLDLYAFDASSKESPPKRLSKSMKRYSDSGFKYIMGVSADTPQECFHKMLKRLRILDEKLTFIKTLNINGEYNDEQK